jgi:hypothetical protein
MVERKEFKKPVCVFLRNCELLELQAGSAVELLLKKEIS